MDKTQGQEMDHNDRQPATGSKRKGSEIAPREKVDYEIREVIRAYPEDYPGIIRGLAEFTKQYD
jgi:hypothetical protein